MKFNIIFFRRNAKIKGVSEITLRATVNGVKGSMTVPNLKINKNKWTTVYLNGNIDKAFDLVQKQTRLRNHYSTCRVLLDLKTELIALAETLPKTITGKQLISEYKKIKDKPINEIIKVNSIHDFFTEFIKRALTIPNKITGEIVSEGRIAQFNTALDLIKSFAITNQNSLTFENINIEWYEDLLMYLANDCGYHHNTVYKNHKIYKQIFESAFKNGIFDGWAELKEIIPNLKEIEAENIYVNDAELYELTNLNLQNELQKRVRDWFIIGCYTGLRFEDLIKLDKTMIEGNFIHYRKIDTNKKHTVSIPIQKPLRSVLLKYRNTASGFPKKMHNGTGNRVIKEVFSLLPKFRETTDKTKADGLGKVKYVLIPKFQAISFHCARRSFCTNLYKQGIPIQQIMNVSGHKREDTFYRYIKLSSRERGDALLNSLNNLKTENTSVDGVYRKGHRLFIDLNEYPLNFDAIILLLAETA